MNNKQSFFQYGLISVFLINLIECNFLLTNYHIYSPSSISNNNNVISNHISYSGNYLFLILIKKLIIKNHCILYIYIYIIRIKLKKNKELFLILDHLIRQK
jgi:hypothetical protein